VEWRGYVGEIAYIGVNNGITAVGKHTTVTMLAVSSTLIY